MTKYVRIPKMPITASLAVDTEFVDFITQQMYQGSVNRRGLEAYWVFYHSDELEQYLANVDPNCWMLAHIEQSGRLVTESFAWCRVIVISISLLNTSYDDLERMTVGYKTGWPMINYVKSHLPHRVTDNPNIFICSNNRFYIRPRTQ